MAYRENLIDTGYLAIFATAQVVSRVEKALRDGRRVELEHTSFSDPGPDETRVLIDGSRVLTLPGY